jgi:predicted  nucleic acid-binding Zn-ribbon protein
MQTHSRFLQSLPPEKEHRLLSQGVPQGLEAPSPTPKAGREQQEGEQIQTVEGAEETTGEVRDEAAEVSDETSQQLLQHLDQEIAVTIATLESQDAKTMPEYRETLQDTLNTLQERKKKLEKKETPKEQETGKQGKAAGQSTGPSDPARATEKVGTGETAGEDNEKKGEEPSSPEGRKQNLLERPIPNTVKWIRANLLEVEQELAKERRKQVKERDEQRISKLEQRRAELKEKLRTTFDEVDRATIEKLKSDPLLQFALTLAKNKETREALIRHFYGVNGYEVKIEGVEKEIKAVTLTPTSRVEGFAQLLHFVIFWFTVLQVVQGKEKTSERKEAATANPPTAPGQKPRENASSQPAPAPPTVPTPSEQGEQTPGTPETPDAHRKIEGLIKNTQAPEGMGIDWEKRAIFLTEEGVKSLEERSGGWQVERKGEEVILRIPGSQAELRLNKVGDRYELNILENAQAATALLEAQKSLKEVSLPTPTPQERMHSEIQNEMAERSSLEGLAKEVEEKLEKLNGTMEEINRRVKTMEQRLGELTQQIQALEEELKGLQGGEHTLKRLERGGMLLRAQAELEATKKDLESHKEERQRLSQEREGLELRQKELRKMQEEKEKPQKLPPAAEAPTGQLREDQDGYRWEKGTDGFWRLQEGYERNRGSGYDGSTWSHRLMDERGVKIV